LEPQITWEGKRMVDLKVSNIMKREVVTSNPKETLSKAISKMSNRSLHEIPVIDDNNLLLGYIGFDILARKKHIPFYTKIERLMVAPPKIEESATIFEAARVMLETGFRATPVVDDETRLQGIISRTDIIQAVPDFEDIGGERAEEIMTPEPTVLELSDDVEKALSLIVELNEFCAPVVDKNGKISGGVLIENISRTMWYVEEGEYVGDVVGENSKPNIEILSYISPVAVVKKEDTLRDICKEMGKINPYLCIVSDDSQRPIGVITQYDILKKLVKYTPEKGVFVDITGLEITDPLVYSSMVSKIERLIKKIGEFNWINPYNLNLHVVNYEKGGGRSKWSIRAKLSTDKGLFYVKAFGWDILKCVDEIVRELNRQLIALKKR
jgi:CBS domain-containing protein